VPGAFVPVETMPEWLQTYNKVNPVSIVVNAVRALCLGVDSAEYVVKALIAIAVILAIFVPLCVNRYRGAV
jgi:ABC-type multidrug transport system permease subunit